MTRFVCRNRWELPDMNFYDSSVEAQAVRWIEDNRKESERHRRWLEDNRRRVRTGGMNYWNSSVEQIEPETLKILKEAMENLPHQVGRADMARCGCEFNTEGDIHLCDFHMGYDSGVDALKRKFEDEEARSNAEKGQG